MVPARGQAEMVDLTLRGLSNSSLISHQLRQIHHNENKQMQALLFFMASSCLAKSAKVSKLGRHEGCVAWGKQVPKGSFSPFSCLTLQPISQLLFIQVVEKRRGWWKGLYTPHSWKLIGLFTTLSVLRVRKCSSWSKSLRNLPPFSSWPCLWMT